MVPLNISPEAQRYRALIGTGGIGAGTFFALQGNQTLGREESRGGRFLPARDYCKLHIIAHYVQTLAGSSFVTLPIGRVGQDEMGERLLGEMRAAGLDVRHVQVCPDRPTLHAICLVYPDGTGGNLTVDDSACAAVDAAQVDRATPDFEQFAGQGVALAVPEVPLEARRELLALGTTHGFVRAASFTSGEMQPAMTAGLFGQLDLLAMNTDEAAALLGQRPEHKPLADLAQRVVETLRPRYPALQLLVTGGLAGSWVWDGAALTHRPAVPVEAVNAAGAGDAMLAGLLVGLIAGLCLEDAHALGSLTAAVSVTSPHTLHPALDRTTLAALAAAQPIALSEPVRRLLEDAA